MKTLAACVFAGLVCLATFPVVFASGDAPARACSTGGIDPILATIRQLESGGDYQVRASGSTASGAYQFIDTTWAGYGGYPSAWLAPPDVQDAKATEYVAAILDAHDGDVASVPVVWYIGHVPAAGSAEWDSVPYPSAGNVLTPREYQARWLAAYENRSGDTSDEANRAAPCLAGGSIAALPGGWALPGPAELLAATHAQIDRPHHNYPAWDWAIPEGTPIYAMRGGRVASVTTFPRNWWDYGCEAGAVGCDACGIGVTLIDDQGARWTYCHGQALHVSPDDIITAGMQILTSGNTGRSSGPHLHLEINADGVQRCPQPLVLSLVDSGIGIDLSALPSAGCSY